MKLAASEGGITSADPFLVFKLLLHLKLIREALEEKHAEDVLFVFGYVQFSTQDIGRFEKMSFELCKR